MSERVEEASAAFCIDCRHRLLPVLTRGLWTVVAQGITTVYTVTWHGDDDGPMRPCWASLWRARRGQD